MRSLVYVDLFNRTLLSSPSGDAYRFPQPLPSRQGFTMALRFVDVLSGSRVEVEPRVRSLKASIGWTDRRPLTGQYKIQIGGGISTIANTTIALEWNATAVQVEAALNALAAKPSAIKVDQVDESLLIYREGGGVLALQVVSNKLRPSSFGRIEGEQKPDGWVYELRLIQEQLAFVDSSEQILPPEPTIKTVVVGGTDTAGTYFQNAVQRFFRPPSFQALYYFRRVSPTTGPARTRLLSPAEDGEEQIQAAVNEMLASEGGICTASLPATNMVDIEFSGSLKGTPIDDLEIVIPEESTPPGDWTFTLPLGQPAMNAALRAIAELKDVPFELELEWVPLSEDFEDEDAPTETIRISSTVTLARALLWSGLATAQNPNWQRGISPRVYTPFVVSQVLTGQQQAYPEVIGDGAALEFPIDHNLDSEFVTVQVRENVSTGRLLRDSEYQVDFNGSNSLTVSFTDAPAEDAYAVLVVSVGPASVFQAHSHTIAQIEGLQDILDQYGTDIADLKVILPTTGLGASSTDGKGSVTKLQKIQEVLFADPSIVDLFSEDGVDVAKLGDYSRPLMLPACHDAVVDSAAVLPAVAGNTGKVFTNDTGAIQSLGSGYRGGKVALGGFFASDGRTLFAASRGGATKSYYPRGFERELWRDFVNDKQLLTNRTYDVQFGLSIQLLQASSNAQWVLVIEKGTAPQEATPSPTDSNLENVVWDTAAPILSQRLILTSLMRSHSFGVRIKRSQLGLVDTLSMDTMLYGAWTGNNAAAPATANFAMRARLINFDTENALAADARGWVFYEITDAEGLDGGTIPAQARIY